MVGVTYQLSCVTGPAGDTHTQYLLTKIQAVALPCMSGSLILSQRSKDIHPTSVSVSRLHTLTVPSSEQDKKLDPDM